MLDTALRDMGEGFVPQLLADPPENCHMTVKKLPKT